jgi:DNA processing protein
MDEKIAIIALQKLKGVDYILKRRLIEAQENLDSLFKGKVRLSDEGVYKKIVAFKGWKDIDRDMKRVKDMGAEVVTIKDVEYPAQLRNIPDAPLVLYKKGGLEIGPDTIAIVGSRKASFESINMAEKIAQTLSSAGITIISGLARGVDAAAHRGALKEKGKTIGVLGCGIDICYPAENRSLFEKVGQKGCILTEYALGEQPLPHHFPRRNRIIAGLSKGVLVVEASQKSGSLITARLGLEYGREVMAVPGSIFDEGYKGANSLIKQGAKLIDGIEDIITTCFPYLTVKKDKQVDLDSNERYIYGIIGPTKIHVDEVIEKSGMETRNVMAILTNLELKEAIRGMPGGFYLRK